MARTKTVLRRRVRRVGRRVLAAAGRMLEVTLRASRRRADAPAAGSSVTFLLWNAHSLGGTVQSVFRQANGLVARGRRVRIIAIERRVDQGGLHFPLDERVELRVLVDLEDLQRAPGVGGRIARALHRLPSVLIHPREGRAKRASLLIDVRTVRALGRVRTGVVVGTRLGLNLLVARFRVPGVIGVAQEHLLLNAYSPPLPDGIRRHFPRLDVIACLSEADAADYRQLLGRRAPRVVVVPNSVPEPLPEVAAGDKVLLGVGHLTAPAKGFDRLVEVFGGLAGAHPGWELRIVGAGSPRRLLAAARRHGVEDRVTLPGPSRDVAAAYRAASVLALPSRLEAFSLVLIEAMAAGLPVVSFDCPGPAEIITDELDGLLVPQGDLEAFAAALDRVLGDDDLRDRLGRAARRTAEQRYRSGPVTDRWIEVFDAAARPVNPSGPANGLRLRWPGLGFHWRRRGGTGRFASPSQGGSVASG